MDKEWKKLETIPDWQLDKVKSKKEVILEAQRDKKESPIWYVDGHMSLSKSAELEPKLQKWQGRVVIRGDIVRDDSGVCAVFTEQGSSASHMTAAKVMDVFARLPDCDGHAADAVSVYTQVKNRRRSEIVLKIPKSECPDLWICLPRHKWPKSWSDIEDPEVPLERNLYGHPLAGLLWERQFEEVLLELGWEKGPNWECPYVRRNQGLSLSVYVDDNKCLERSRI